MLESDHFGESIADANTKKYVFYLDKSPRNCGKGKPITYCDSDSSDFQSATFSSFMGESVVDKGGML